MKIRRVIKVILLTPLLLALVLVAYLKISDLSELRPYVNRFVSKLIHRTLVIEGDFSASIGSQITVHAKNVRLANPDWASKPFMVEVDSVSITLDTRSLFSPPIRFIEASALGARLNLEKNRDGVGSWEFPKKKSEGKPKGKPTQLIFEKLKLSDIHLVFADRSRDRKPIHLNLEAGEVIRLEDATYRVETFKGAWETNKFQIHGIVGKRPSFMGTDLTFEGTGSDISPLANPAKINLPAGSYALRGRVERHPAGFQFHDFLFESGGYRLSLKGQLGNFPRFDETDFQIQAKGPNLSVLSEIVDLATLPDAPFEVSAALNGNPTRFKSDHFNIRLGKSDVGGSFSLNSKTDPPQLAFKLSSHQIDLSWLSSAHRTESKSEETPKKQLLLSGESLNLDFLKKLDAQLHWKAGIVLSSFMNPRNVLIDLGLKNGRLELSRAEASRGQNERIHLNFLLEPVERAYHIHTQFHAENLKPNFFGGVLENRPGIDLKFNFDGTGVSSRELALRGKGYFHANVSAGLMKQKLGDLFTTDILKKIASSLNPLQKEKEEAKLECAALVANLGDGVAKLDGLAVQTDTTTIAGDGKIKLEKEELEFEWVSKPRTGIGLSASSLSEPYVKLGGTLADPRLEVKVLSAGVSTGVAIATLGLSVLAKGVWNRISAEGEVCNGVREKFEKSLVSFPEPGIETKAPSTVSRKEKKDKTK